MTTFLDTSIVISLLDDADPNHQWSVAQLVERKVEGPAIVSDVVFSEVSVAMRDVSAVNAALSSLGLERISSRDEALFRAGRAYHKYKKENKGPKMGVLPDFFIGAIADVEKGPLMTDNRRDFPGYFPELKLITPPKKIPSQSKFTPSMGALDSTE